MDFSGLLTTIATLFLLLMTGFAASKFHIIDGVASKKLSKLIISIGQPCLIVSSLVKMEYSTENLKLGLKTLALGFAVHGAMALIAFLACKPFKDLDERKLTEFAMIFGNVGFIGFPILESLFGARGVFMGSFFVVSFNLVLWTWGIAILARKRTDIKLTVKKALINYGTIPCAIGILLYVLHLSIPKFILSGVSYLAGLCTPISMLIIGALLAGRTVKQIFASGKIYYLCAMKLVVIPLLLAVIMKLIGFDNDWILFTVAVSSMPSATTVTMLAELYDINSGYSAQTVGTTSLLSILTMPIVLKLTDILLAL
ncbi:MAG: AEC family transporter [Eubacteriales bacterium]